MFRTRSGEWTFVFGFGGVLLIVAAGARVGEAHQGAGAGLVVAALAVGGMALLVGARLHTQLSDRTGEPPVVEPRNRLAPKPTSATVDVDAIATRSTLFGLPEVFIPVPDLGEAAQAAVRYGLFLSGGATIVVHVASDAERAFAIADAWASRHPSLSLAELQLVVADAPTGDLLAEAVLEHRRTRSMPLIVLLPASRGSGARTPAWDAVCQQLAHRLHGAPGVNLTVMA